MAQWHGWWEQRGLGRQPMRGLVLHFGPGVVRGSGHDIIGPFTISGTCGPESAVRFVKQYTGQHAVLYEGTNTGEGVFGVWQIPGLDSGRFALYARQDVAEVEFQAAEPLECAD